ncbi:OmpH family outer membrane protein [Sulfitobacter sp. M85]|nr:OmpH family outer membrane protein [Sulfitobacter sp. Ks11]MDF3387048.1 OmpH family outer membrane protein [Sulfitobacter sp. M85]MDF3390468.1 OmpH family outer membrane protein [Sulfitobacter sp. Ks16]MDF3401105.1 OmpH family outer membrane protein [Sulfitobacter sp. KE39]MDF3404526.1 OmpH family outer membrane protein [Sulfitobacter sp. Ks35]MDF3411604.1 OmpH family outer membrane protein [Sulfitobacter sp. KE38]
MMLAGVTPGLAQQAPAAKPQTNTAAPTGGGVISPVLTIDSERLFRDSAFGQRVSREIEAQSEELAAENREIEAALEAEERELTEKRSQLKPAQFRLLADAFDEKVQRTRAEQAAKNRALSEALDLERERFLAAAAPVLEQLMRNSDAAVILERRRVFVSSSAIEVTDEAIALLNETIGSGLTDAE